MTMMQLGWPQLAQNRFGWLYLLDDDSLIMAADCTLILVINHFQHFLHQSKTTETETK